MTSNIRLRIGAFATAAILAMGSLAGATKVPTDGQVQKKAPRVKIVSYGAKKGINRDPTIYQFRDIEPGSTLFVKRQAKSQVVEVRGEQTVESLKKLSLQAAMYAEVKTFKPKVTSILDQVAESLDEEGLILWPNTPVLVDGVDRDGQLLPRTAISVAGLPTTRVTELNPTTLQTEPYDLSGAHLPSARAWVKPENYYVSEPYRDVEKVKQGEALLEQAREATGAIEKKQTLINAEQEKQKQGKPYDGNLVRTLQSEIAPLKTQVANATRDGNLAKADGERVRVNVISVGAFGSQAQVKVVNPRLSRPNIGHPTLDGVTEPISGYFNGEVDAVHVDELVTTVSFPAVPGQKNGSYVTFKHTAPSVGQPGAAFHMGNIAYYRVKARDIEKHHQDPVADR